MIKKKDLIVVAAVLLLTAVAVEGAGIWLARVNAPIAYDEEAAYVETLEATNVTENSATLNGELVHLRGYEDVDLYFEYREEGDENGWTVVDSNDDASESTEFSEEVTDLTEETAYEYRAVVEDEEVLDHGLIIGFITLEPAGDGSEEDPYAISDWYELYAIRNEMDAYYELTDDIDENSDGYEELVGADEGWHPIGTQTVRFAGSFDGQGYEIRDLYINRPEENNQGIFAHAGHNTEETIIRNVCVIDAQVTGARGVGTLLGRVTGNANTLIEKNCAVDGEVKGTGAVGGLIGSFNSWRETPGGEDNPLLSQSFADVDVNDHDLVTGNYDKFGGLVGCSQKGSIKNSYALGPVTVEDAGEKIGGLAGCVDFRGIIENTYSTGEVTAGNSERVGALIGDVEGRGGNAGRIIYSYSNEETSSQTELVGEVGDGDVTGGMRTTEEMTWEYSDDPDVYEEWDMAEDGSEIWLSGDHDLVEDREENSGYPALQWQDE